MRISLQAINHKSSTSVGSFSLEEIHERRYKRNGLPCRCLKSNYLVPPLVASRHEDECQVQAQTVKREGDGKEGEGQWSSC